MRSGKASGATLNLRYGQARRTLTTVACAKAADVFALFEEGNRVKRVRVVVEARCHRRRVHDGDVDAARLELNRKGCAEGRHKRLGRAIHTAERAWLACSGGRREHDAAALLLRQHARHEDVRDLHRAHGVALQVRHILAQWSVVYARRRVSRTGDAGTGSRSARTHVLSKKPVTMKPALLKRIVTSRSAVASSMVFRYAPGVPRLTPTWQTGTVSERSSRLSTQRRARRGDAGAARLAELLLRERHLQLRKRGVKQRVLRLAFAQRRADA